MSKFFLMTVASTIAGILGGWLGNFVGLGTSLVLGFIFSVFGWYWAKHLMKYK